MRKYLQNKKPPITRYRNITVVAKDQLTNVSFESVFKLLDSLLIPKQYFDIIEYLIVGSTSDMEKREIDSMYTNGIISITHKNDNEMDFVENFVHELAHAVEEHYSYEIYGNSLIKNEFLIKRNQLFNRLSQISDKIPLELKNNVEFSERNDNFLYKKIGYDTLSIISADIFLSSYSVTSLREYFAIGFEYFYTGKEDRNYIKKICPYLCEKIENLHNLTQDGE